MTIYVNKIAQNISLEKSQIICCDGLLSLEIEAPDRQFKKNAGFISCPQIEEDYFQVSHQEIFNLKISKSISIGDVVNRIVDSFVKKGLRYIFINPAGSDPNGVENIVNHLNEVKNKSSQTCFILILSHSDFHNLFEDQSIRVLDLGSLTAKEYFRIK